MREPLIVQKQVIHQQKALDLSFNLAHQKWAWLYQEGATPSRREKHRSAWGKKSSFTATHLHALLIMPRPLSRCQIKAEIKDFLLKYHLFQYKQWFFQILNSNIFRIRLLHPVLHFFQIHNYKKIFVLSLPCDCHKYSKKSSI